MSDLGKAMAFAVWVGVVLAAVAGAVLGGALVALGFWLFGSAQ